MDDDAREFAAALGEVLSQFGRRVIDRPDVLRGALSDTLGGAAEEHREQVDAVVAASRVGVAGKIRDSGTRGATPEEVRAWFDQLVEAGIALRDAALATRSWAEVLDASETARVTTEISEGLIDPDDGRAVGRITSQSAEVEREPVTRLSSDESMTELSVVSAYGDEDRTVMPPPAAPEPAPADGSDANATLPLSLDPDTPPPFADPPPADRTATRWTSYLPTLAAVLAIGLTLVIGIPIIQANATPQTLPAFTPVEVPDVEQLFARQDLSQFALSEDTLRALVPKAGTVVPPEGRSQPYTLGFDAVDAACATEFATITEGDESDSSVFISAAYDTANWLWIDSVSRWYESSVLAENAMEALMQDPCSSPRVVNDGNTFTSTFTAAGSSWVDGVRVERSTLKVNSGPPWLHHRHCYVNRNIVTCVSLSGTGIAGVGAVTPGVAFDQTLDSIFTTVAPYRLMEPFRQAGS